jgi:hypothetical protein
MATTKTKPPGYIVYKGPSVLDGAPIVMIATLKTNNRKTGPMVQTWILREDMSPLEAADPNVKADASICGNCPHRWSLGGACYVNLAKAPTSIYRAYKRGSYAPLTDLPNATLHDLLHDRHIRLGAYGDPAAVPARILRSLVTFASGHTGYTHQMRHKNFDPEVLQYCMASVDTEKSAEKAWASKARTFRIVKDISEMKQDGSEIECLSDSHGIRCDICMLCDGKTSGLGNPLTTNNNHDQNTQPKPNIVIAVHGNRAKRFLNNKAAKAA